MTPEVLTADSVSITGTLDSLKTVVTYFLEEFGAIVTAIATSPLLLLPVGFFVIGGCIGLAKRLIR